MKKLSKVITRSTYGAALVVLFGVNPFAGLYASIDSSSRKTVPTFEGLWEINRRKSDDPQSKMREAMGRRHGGGLRDGRSSGGGGGLPSGDGFPGEPPLGDSPERGKPPSGTQVGNASAPTEESMRAADILQIFQSDSEITVNETGDDRLVNTQTFYTDGRKTHQDTEYGKLETNAKWVGNKLVVETKSQRGGKMT